MVVSMLSEASMKIKGIREDVGLLVHVVMIIAILLLCQKSLRLLLSLLWFLGSICRLDNYYLVL